MEILKINYCGYFNFNPLLNNETEYDNEKECCNNNNKNKYLKCEICKDHIVNRSKNITTNINKLFYKDAVVLGSCGHIFHKNCMYEWLKTNDFCPIDKEYWSYNRDLDSVSNLFFSDNENEIKMFNPEEYNIDNLKKKKIKLDKKEENKNLEEKDNIDNIDNYENYNYDYKDFLKKYGKNSEEDYDTNLNFRTDLSIEDFLSSNNKDKKHQQLIKEDNKESDDEMSIYSYNHDDDDFIEEILNESDGEVEILEFKDNIIEYNDIL